MLKTETFLDELREQGRGIAGALLVLGVTFLYTMETWWIAGRLPVGYLVAYALVGLAAVVIVLYFSGFRREQRNQTGMGVRKLAVDFSDLLLQSFLAAYVGLFLFGLLEPGDSLARIARMGFLQVVPLGVGAGLSNQLLAESEETDHDPTDFPANVPGFIFGAVFLASPLAPTEEMVVLAAQTGWFRSAIIVLTSVGVIYLILYEIQFRGYSGRVERRSRTLQLGSSFTAYLVAVTVSVVLLLGSGQLRGATLEESVQLLTVLGFPASVGAAAGEIVL